ncbi:DUF7144 family membrane protein [Actinoplanes siamensis]|uniref:Membrane protein n=1 Tax=Actinoplanes siamensis TaxID=1223317 RepID=A0A919N1Y0_9ACTN|nr:hypothetical protein [Actinoplanes siamensis]GIF02636.1 membrane protein [Actinoplanes siamensis]
MFDTSHPRAGPQPSPWVGMVYFAGVALILTGGFQAIEGLLLLPRDDLTQATADALSIPMDLAVWGWIQLAFGAISVAAGIGVLYGQFWARIVAIVIGTLSALANLAMLPAYPFWSSVVIALDMLCIYAITAHGREIGT